MSTSKQRKRNKELCERYPFLIPRNVWDDQIIWERYKDTKKWDYTLADEFPSGYWKAFGLMMCEELREELIKYNFLDKYRVVQIKEKWGQLRFYDNGYPVGSAISDIIDKYSKLSENICIKCGKPDVHILNYYGWISPYCEDCFQPQPYEYFFIEGDTGKMSDVLKYRKYNKDSNATEEVEIDISETAKAIRENYYGRVTGQRN